MSRDVNKVILIGRLGHDPKTRETKKGDAMVSFSLATSRKLSEEAAKARGIPLDGRMEETQWHNIVAWGKQAEICSKYLKKGSSVYVEGSLRSHKYDGSDGARKTWFEIYVENFSILGSPRRALEELVENPQIEEELAATG